MSTKNRREFLIQTAGAAAAAIAVPLDALGTVEFRAAPEAARPARAAAPVSVGVIGTGRQGRAMIAELQKIEGVTIAAVCDIDEARLSAAARRAAGAEGFTDHRALLDKRRDVQAVLIATPTHLHRQPALDALQAGKHVYCDGPLASTLEDCRAIVQAARRASTVFQVGMEGRSNPVYKLARTFFKSDTVRDPVSGRAQNYAKTNWRFPASTPDAERRVNWRLDESVSIGLAGELGTHQFDVAHWYLGQYPVAVRGWGSIRLHDDGRKVPDTICCDLKYPSGVVVQYAASLGNSYEGRYEVLHGTNAAVKLAWTHGWMFKEADAPTQGWEVYANRQQFHNDEGITLIADATQLASQGKLKEGVGLPHPSLYYGVADFIRSVTEGAAVACSAEEGLRAAAVGIAANQAVVSGAEVAVTPDMLKAE